MNDAERESAIDSGRLLDATDLAHRLGHCVLVAVTPLVWSETIIPAPEVIEDSPLTRIRDVLAMLEIAERNSEPGGARLLTRTTYFGVDVSIPRGRTEVHYLCAIRAERDDGTSSLIIATRSDLGDLAAGCSGDAPGRHAQRDSHTSGLLRRAA